MDNPFCGTSASFAEAGHSNEEATCRHQTSHDLALTDPGLFPRASLVQLPGVFGINRNPCSASAENGVRLPRKSAFGLVRNGRSVSPVLHNRCPSEFRTTVKIRTGWDRTLIYGSQHD